MRHFALFLVLAFTFSVPAEARQSLGVFEGWGAFRDPATPRCYAIAQPANHKAKGDWPAFAAIGYWPKKGVRGQLHFHLSREKAARAKVTLAIGIRRFELIGGRADAWARDKRIDAAIIAAIRSASGMSLQTVGKGGSAFRDTYALRGAATAIDAAALGCARS